MVNLKDGLKKLPIEIMAGTQDEAAVPEIEGDLTLRIGKDNRWAVAHLPSGSYQAIETQAGYGTTVNTKAYKFTIAKQNDETPVITIDQDLPNQALVWNMMFTKVLEVNSSLTGLNDATFAIKAMDENTQTAFDNYGFTNNGDTCTSGTTVDGNGFTTDGLVAFYQVPLGTRPNKDGVIAHYQIVETKTPEGTKTIVPIDVKAVLKTNSNGKAESYTFTFRWSDSAQVIHQETISTATLKDDQTLTIRPNLGLIADEFITQPTIKTTAVDEADGDKKLVVGQVKIHDTAVVTNLSPSTDYTMTGEVVHTADGRPKLNENGQAITVTVPFTTDLQGNAVVQLDTQAFDSTPEQGKKYTMLETAKDELGQIVVKEDNWKNNPEQTVEVEFLHPSIDIEKSNGKTPDAGHGNHTDKDNNIGENDHDTEDTYFEVKSGASTEIYFRGTNNGTEPLTHIKVVDKTTQGSINIKGMSFTFNNKKLTVNKDGEFELDGKLLVLQPKEFILGSGTLDVLPAGELHGDEVTITGVGLYSKKKVGDLDQWFGKVLPQETPVDKLLNIYLPKTGDSKSILTALGAWLITVALIAVVVLNERKRHTVRAGINQFKRHIKF
ncbi:VaFE repeat-containing surface-anchored protein [Lactococcus allomyrinae]|uniref:VaFE repeat-containing surface-anchored protein n=1 Tax=Lactococcus allomyrinae TaxID=2419773 RepID=UPI0013C48D9C|nr:VaFE repeat-containing surface-anchored protein [Lactococcus allomyrinae]